MHLPPEKYSDVELIDKSVAELAKKLRELDYQHAWALIVVVEWVWEHHDQGIDIKKDPWWTLAFRRQFLQKRTPKKAPKRR